MKVFSVKTILLFLIFPAPGLLLGQDFIVFDEVISVEEKHNGFYYFQPPEEPSNWIEPFDFFNGRAYIRYEIMDYPTQKGLMLNVCIWSDIEGNWEKWKETCSPRLSFETNDIYTIESSPSDWWQLNETVDFARAVDFEKMGLVVWCPERKNVSQWMSEENSCWDQRADYYPLKLRLTIVLVAVGYKFEGWEKYMNRKNDSLSGKVKFK